MTITADGFQTADLISITADGSAGANYLLSLAQGSFVLSGQNLAESVGNSILGYTVLLSPALFDLFGADVNSNFELNPVYQSFSLTGNPILFNSTSFIPLNYGLFNLTGESLTFNEVAPLSVGLFTINGQSLTFFRGGGATAQYRPVTVSGGRVVLPSKKLSEILTYTFDFISALVPGETIVSATVTSNVWSGVDSNPSAMIDGVPTINGTVVNQFIAQGVAGVIYDLICAATTSLGQVIEISGYIAVQPDVS